MSNSHATNNEITQELRMPAEWEKHESTWLCWPIHEKMWSRQLENVRNEMTTLIKTIAQFEKVNLLIHDQDAYNSAQNYLGFTDQVTFHKTPMNDIWFRDNGPLFVKSDNQVLMTKWEFNSWGKKFQWDLDNEVPYYVSQNLNMSPIKTNIIMEGGSLDINGSGIALTTKQCLLSPMRNKNLTATEIEKYLEKYLGIKKCLWLENGLEGDHTDGHIDTIVRFVSENKIVCSYTEDKQDVNHKTMNENMTKLKSFTNLKGEPFEIIPLTLPKNRMELDGDRLPCTYANFYIGNGFVVVPQYDDPYDKIALNTISSLFPNRKVIGLDSKFIIMGGGSFHCLTQQQPL